MGGCALIGQSLINVQSGGTSRLSGMTMSAFLGLGIFAAAPLLGQVPVASLVGVMLLVCYSTFSWSSLRIMRKIPRTDAFVGDKRARPKLARQPPPTQAVGPHSSSDAPTFHL